MHHQHDKKIIWPDGGLKRHFTGRFSKKIADAIAKGIAVIGADKSRYYVIVDTVKIGNNPFVEEINIRFRVSKKAPPKEHVVKWKGMFEREERRTAETAVHNPSKEAAAESTLFFTFTNEIPFEENMADFRQYVLDYGMRAERAPMPKKESGDK